VTCEEESEKWQRTDFVEVAVRDLVTVNFSRVSWRQLCIAVGVAVVSDWWRSGMVKWYLRWHTVTLVRLFDR
jgi:hypothetical protein